MNTLIEKALRWIVIGGIFALPFIVLIVAQSLFFPFITGKNFAFRLIVEAIAGAWIALALISPLYRPKRTWLLIGFTAFVLIMAVADLFSVNALKSIWSNFERMEGWVTLAHLFMLFVVASSVLTTEKLWRRFWSTSIAVSVAVGLYGLLQLAGVLTINQGGVRLDATFGNATYLAAYMMFHLFITAMLWAQLWYEGKKRLMWTLIALPIMTLQLSILFFTATRGAILGVLGGALLTAILLVILARNSRNVWRVSVAAVVTILILVGGFFLLKDTQFVRDIEPLQRLSSISLSDSTTKARFLNWSMAWQGFQERPFLGWGQESYNIVFNTYYEPEMYAQEQWFDRVHNVFFDWLVAGGILGLLAYLSLFATALWMLWKSGVFSIPERALLTGLFAAYFFHNLFVFDNITSYLFFIFVLAYIASRVAREKQLPVIAGRFALSPKMIPAAAALGVVLAIGTMVGVNASAYAANRALLNAVSPQPSLLDNIAAFEKAIEYGTYGSQEAREQLVQGAMGLAGNASVPAEVQQKLLESAKKGMLDQMEASPLDARFPFFLGALLGSYGQYQEAQQYLLKAKELSPNKQSIRYQLALNMLNVGQANEAFALLKETVELAPENPDAQLFYAMAAIRAGEDTLADQLVAALIEKGIAGDQRIISAYAARKQYSKIAQIWEAHLVKNPQDPQAQFGLAAAYYAGGEKAKAIAQLEKIAATTTDANLKAQAEELIKQIRAGTLQL